MGKPEKSVVTSNFTCDICGTIESVHRIFMTSASCGSVPKPASWCEIYVVAQSLADESKWHSPRKLMCPSCRRKLSNEHKAGKIPYNQTALAEAGLAAIVQFIEGGGDDMEYNRGFHDGLAAYAWWKDGEQFVGSPARSLGAAIASIPNTHNYNPPTNRRREERDDS